MKFCKNCGAQLKDDAKFCPKCGIPCDAQMNEAAKAEPENSAVQTGSAAQAQPAQTARVSEPQKPAYTNPQNQQSAKAKKPANKGLIIALIAVLVLAAAAVVYFAFIKPKSDASEEDTAVHETWESSDQSKKPGASDKADDSEKSDTGSDKSSAPAVTEAAKDTAAETEAAPAATEAAQADDSASMTGEFASTDGDNMTVEKHGDTVLFSFTINPVNAHYTGEYTGPITANQPIQVECIGENRYNEAWNTNPVSIIFDGRESITVTTDEYYTPVIYSRSNVGMSANAASSIGSSDSAAYVSEMESANQLYIIGCDECVTLREFPDKSAKALSRVPLWESVENLGPAGNGFTMVAYNGKVGYILTEYLDFYEPQCYTGITLTVSDCQKSITLRTGPTTEHEEICQIPLGAVVDYIDEKRDFYLVSYNGKKGYAMKKYLK